ncbi:MAG: hypothetical protein M1833_004531 [Piccolia ochrophora]|nr:MAG: hypothetical protein M1833_004531 [Piccolia ochrophora]
MASLDLSADGFVDVGVDPRHPRYPTYSSTRTSWDMTLEQNLQQAVDIQRTTPPLQTTSQAYHTTDNSPLLLNDWSIQQTSHVPFAQDGSSLAPHFASSFGAPFQTSPIEFMPTSQASLPTSLQTGLGMEGSFLPLGNNGETLQWNFDFDNDLMAYANQQALSDTALTQRSFSASSPTDLEVRSLTSSSSDNGWASIDYQSLESFQDPQNAVFNPGETLHIRTNSDSSQSDGTGYARTSIDSFEEISYPLTSPDSDTHCDLSQLQHRHSPISPSTALEPVPIKPSGSPLTSPSHPRHSPPARRQSRKSPTAKSTKPAIRRPAQGARKDAEKRVGRRRGPLLPEQRKQASEIRKLRACLRCKFLKKTCDKGEPCAGCQPSHARLWQVPCTRIDIKDVAYFMKDWKADFERHVTLGFSIGNIKGFSSDERCLYITHGYGFILPVTAREVYVRDEKCFSVDWVESIHETPLEFVIPTAKLSAGMEGISTRLLSEYLDKHIDSRFEQWVDDHFEGTPFLTEMLKTAYRFYLRERQPIIRKALKLVLAYNLTLHVTMVEGLTEEEKLVGQVNEESSKFRGKILAPVMINFQVKCALADMWRELQKEILEELSTLYSSVYSGDKLKNWPTIFLLAAILLAVWEEMQFDCHYRVPDSSAVQKFCTDMETIPVGVIVGLFCAISQKLPSFAEWDTRKHHHLLNSNRAVCDTMTEVREHVTKYDTYLRCRSDATFDRKNFDSLSNKFVSKLVIRAN